MRRFSLLDPNFKPANYAAPQTEKVFPYKTVEAWEKLIAEARLSIATELNRK